MMTYPTIPLADATLAEFNWLTGEWAGEIHGESIEEHWSAPANDALMGMFRWVRSTKGPLYEFLLLEQESEGGVTMRLKHFNPGLIGWEEKRQSVVFALVSRDEGIFVFRMQSEEPSALSLVYQPIEEGGLLVYFVKDGETPDPEAGFRYVRQPL